LAGGAPWQESQDWPAQWFELDAVPRVVVGRDLAVLATNLRADRLIDDGGCGLALRDGALAARDRKIELELSAAVASAGNGARSFVIGAKGGSAVLVEAFALGDGADGPVALSLRDLTTTVEIECADLEPIFGVTPGEHQVIVRLLQGYSSRDIADKFGKSILTIRTHVKRAYGKIGVKTRGQLFARLLPYLTIR
jgi:DNA-binding CsgD family transcriptional regulator